MGKHIVVYRLHGQLNCETQYIGPFETFGDADDYLCFLPALGICPEGEQPGVKFVQEVMTPKQHDLTMKLEAEGFDHIDAVKLALLTF